ncbi:MAG: sugar transferase [Magnetococcales bacterium]|nr:sugar transferase [Magnetococcales bacterium]NGZ25595.1 sugar transferase [Magnetococcales bacterium]
MLKRLFDILASASGLILLSPLLLPVLLLIWLQDFNSPFYIANRIAKGGGRFRMVKLRSMVVDAAKTGVNSTSASDRRITPIGHFVRKFKLDELAQLLNVLIGDMSLVGPRPQVEVDASLYTEIERQMLTVRPGITDFSSIVFSDEGDILAGSDNPDLKYNQIIRPWKSRLALLYVEHQSLWLDVTLIWLTILSMVSRERALKAIVQIVSKYSSDELLIRMTGRQEPLLAYPPPGAHDIVSSYP